MKVAHEPAASRFVAQLPEGAAVLIYRMKSDRIMDVLSTHVPEAARGQGVGAGLVAAALAHARDHELRVIPTCWYVETWVGRHPEYRALLAD
jgi:predicted GNAT family acetyltransferase